MSSQLSRLLSIAVVLAAVQCVAAQKPAEKKENSKPSAAKKEASPDKNVSYLPAPLGLIRGNIRDLESTSYFKIDDVELRTLATGNEALVWTVRVETAITCRHIEAILKQYRDVRFYSTLKKRRLEVMSALMQYSERVRLGSANDLLLRQDDVFELSVTLRSTDVRKLISLDVDRIVFRRWKY